MSKPDFGYEGKRVLVVGGATGMGAAAAQGAAALGADVIVLDVAPIEYPCAQSLQVDLRDKANVDATLAQIDGPIHAIFSCAGIGDGPGLMLINFTSQRHIVDRLLADGKLAQGAGVVMIASGAGIGWQNSLELTLDFLRCSDWDAAAKWVEEHPGTDNYLFSKQALCAYVAHEAMALLKQGVRLNAVLPGPTDTPLARANADVWLAFAEPYRKELGLQPLTPQQIGDAMIFLCSPAASGLAGTILNIDFGHTNAVIAGAYDDPAVKGLLGLLG